jgi:hypothetical protein
VSEMTLLAHLRTPRLDRDAAFDAAVRDGRLPSRDRCPTCGQIIVPAASPPPAASPAQPSPAQPAPATRALSVDEELAALGSGQPVR